MTPRDVALPPAPATARARPEHRPARVVLRAVRTRGRRELMLDHVTLRLETGARTLAVGEPGHGHTALALVATGRLVPDAGDVLVDGMPDPARLRAASAVVDVPGVSEPDEALTVAGTAAEGLALAGRRATPRAVAAFLAGLGLADDRTTRIDQLPALSRTTLLAALATQDPAVRFLTLTLPDRHGGAPEGWWALAGELAARGYGVLVQCTSASAQVLRAGGHLDHATEVLL